MVTRLLTVLPLLLCPLLMLACVWAMRNRQTPQRQTLDRQQDLPAAERVAQLEREPAELRRHLSRASAAGESASAVQVAPQRGSRNHTGAAGLTGRR